jgi:hypothetical protein
MNAEQKRLTGIHWKKWGPYVSDRQWGTVREDIAPTERWRHTTMIWQEAKHTGGVKKVSAAFAMTGNYCVFICILNKKDPIIKERHFA